jgi:hypothetical protein
MQKDATVRFLSWEGLLGPSLGMFQKRTEYDILAPNKSYIKPQGKPPKYLPVRKTARAVS